MQSNMETYPKDCEEDKFLFQNQACKIADLPLKQIALLFEDVDRMQCSKSTVDERRDVGLSSRVRVEGFDHRTACILP